MRNSTFSKLSGGVRANIQNILGLVGFRQPGKPAFYLLLVCLLAFNGAMAQTTYTWKGLGVTGGTGNGVLNTSTNWTPTGVPGAADIANITFTAPATASPLTMNASMTIGQINMTSTTALTTAEAFTITTGAFTLATSASVQNGNFTMYNSCTGKVATFNVVVSTGGTLSIAGNLTMSNNGVAVNQKDVTEITTTGTITVAGATNLSSSATVAAITEITFGSGSLTTFNGNVTYDAGSSTSASVQTNYSASAASTCSVYYDANLTFGPRSETVNITSTTSPVVYFDGTGSQTITDGGYYFYNIFPNMQVGKVNTPTVTINLGGIAIDASLYIFTNLTVNTGATLIMGASGATEATTANLDNYYYYPDEVATNGTFTILGTIQMNGLYNDALGSAAYCNMPQGFTTYTIGNASTFIYNTTYGAQNTGLSGAFENMIINNAAGVTLYTGVASTIAGTLTLTNGNFVNSTVLTMNNGSTITRNVGTLGSAPTWTAGTGTVNLNYVNATAISSANEVPLIASHATTINNLSMNGAGGVTLNTTGGAQVNNVLTLNNGLITSSATFPLKVVNTSPSAIINETTASYVNGPLSWTLPASLSASANSYTFPVGNGGVYLPYGLTTLTTGATTPVITVTATDGPSGGSPGTGLTSISNTEFWNAAVTSGNFTTGSVSLTRQTAVGPNGAVAQSATQGGTYQSLAGTASGDAVTGSNNVASGTLGYFVIATKGSSCTSTPAITTPIGSITSSSASVTFTCPTCSGGTGYVLEYGVHGFTPGVGATAGTGGTVINPATSPQTIPATGSLTAGTTYDVYVRYDCGSAYSLNSPVATFTTLCSTPATPTGLTFSGQTYQQISGSFTTSGANDYLVVYSTSATLTAPVSGTLPLYVAGNSIDGGLGTVAYAGPLTTFTTPNTLTPNTQYYFYIYPYNTGDANGNCGNYPVYGSALTNSTYTCTAAPTGVTATATGGTTASVNYTDPAGATSVILEYGVHPATWPGTTASPAPTVGGSPYNLTGLSAGTIYDIRIEEPNSVCGTFTTVSSAFTTPCAAPATQTINLTGAATGTAGDETITWTNGSGNDRVVMINTVNSFTPPANGTSPTANTAYTGSGQQVIYNGAGATVTITGLTVGQTYWVESFEYCNSSDNYNTATATNNPNSFVGSECVPTPASVAGTVYVGSVVTTGGSTNISVTAGSWPGSYTYYTAPTYPNSTVTQVDNATFTVTVTVGGTPADGYGAGIWVDWADNGTWTNVYSSGNGGQITSTQFSQVVTIPGGQSVGNYRMRVMIDYSSDLPNPCAFNATYGYAGSAADFTVTVGTPCTTPTSLAVGSITANTASATFSCSGCTGTYIVEYGATGFTPGTAGTAGVGGTVVTGAEAGTALSSLSPGTSYDVYVRQNCGSSSYSVNSGVVTFVTLPTCASSPSPANNSTGVCAGVGNSFTWTAPAGESAITGYYFSLGTDVGGTNLVNAAAVSGTSYTYSGSLSTNTVYNWSVTPHTSSGSASGCTIYQFTTGSNATPAAPTLPTVEQGCLNATGEFFYSPNTLGANYYWQGTTEAASTSSVASTTYLPASSGTYYVGAHSGACWSYTSILYNVGSGLGGTYTVGTGGYFTTLTAAITAYNAHPLCGPTILQLLNNISAGETFPITLNVNTGASSVNTLTIEPASSNVTITGNAGEGLIELYGANYVIINGAINGTGTGQNLTIENTNTATGYGVGVWITNNGSAGSSNNTVENCMFIGTGGNTFAGVAISGGANTGTVSTYANNNNLVQNNAVSESFYGVVTNGPTSYQSGNVITGNQIGSTTTADMIGIVGIAVGNENNVQITSNQINGVYETLAATYEMAGIQTSNGMEGATTNISNNTINNVTSPGAGTGWATGICISSPWPAGGAINGNTISNISSANYPADGILMSENTAETAVETIGAGTVNGNMISNVSATSTGGYAAAGILLSTTTTNTGLTVSNNYIWGITAYGYAGTGTNVYFNGNGIDIFEGGGYNIYFNSIYLNTNQSTAGASAAIYVEDPGTHNPATLTIEDNILASTEGTGTNYGVYSTMPSSSFATMDYNDYYVSSGTGYANIGGTNYSTVPNITTNFGGNTHSVIVQPNFKLGSGTYLDLTNYNNFCLASGTSVAGITTDIHGNTRATPEPPDMGADEFDFSFSSTANVTGCEAGPVTITVTGAASTLASGSYTVTYNLTGGNVYTAETATMTYNSGTNTGTFIIPAIQLGNPTATTITITGIQTCTAISTGSAFANKPVVVTGGNTATIAINTPSIVSSITSLNASNNVVCSGGPSQLTQTGGTLGTGATWSWYSDPGFTQLVNTSSAPNAALTVNPTTTTTYYLEATNPSPCSGTVQAAGSVTVNVTAAPSVFITQVDPSGNVNGIVCLATDQAVLTANPSASGVTDFTYSWSDVAHSTTQTLDETPGSYSVTVTNDGCPGATATASATIALATVPTSANIAQADLSGNVNGIVCAGGSATLTANALPTGGSISYSYVWSDGVPTGNVDDVTPANTTTYIVTITNDGCSNASITASSTVAVASAISAGVSETDISGVHNDGIVCVSGSATLTANPAGGTNYTYQWTGGSTNPFITVTPGSTTPYTVTVTNAGCTSVTAGYTVTVDQLAAVPTGNAVMCSGYTISAGASAGVTPYTYSWSGGLSPVANPSVTTAGSYTVSVTDAENCNANGSFNVTQINPLPQATISGSTIVYANSPPVNITFTGSNSTAPYTFTYNFSINGVSQGVFTVTSGNLNGITHVNNAADVATVLCSPGVNQIGNYNYTLVSVQDNSSTHCSQTEFQTVTVLVGDEWLGTNTTWSDPANWNVGYAPIGCGANAIIPGGLTNYPVLQSGDNASVGSIVFLGTSNINLGIYTLQVCGNWSSSGNATISGSDGTNDATQGVVIFNGTTTQTISGATAMNELVINNATGVTLAANANVSVKNALDLVTGNFDVSASNVKFTFTSASPTQAAILDNFSAGNTGTITGNVYAQRAYDISTYFVTKQHMLGFPVHGATLSQIGAAGSSGDVIPQPGCNEYYLEAGSPYGNVFSMVEGNGGTCGVAQWYVEPGSTPDTTGKGYSVLFASAGTLTVNGAPNVATSYTIDGLTNSNWHNPTLQHHTLVSGWHLVTNPYLATLVINTSGGSGMDAQVQVWDDNQGYSGSYQPNLGTNSQTVIAPFQAFMIHVTNPGTANYTISAADRSRTTPSTFYSQNANELDIVSTNLGSGVLDKTVVAFNSAATDNFDTQYDANKIAGGEGRHNLYTMLSGDTTTWMGINTLHDVATTSTVPVGFEPGASGNYSFTFNKINTFDPTTYIYLEDVQQHVMYNVRNGDYLFSSDVTDNWNRFVLHFTPPAIISPVNATCNSLGVINVTQPGTANWNYTLTDGSNTVIASGVLNSSNSVSINAAAGTYTLTLVDNNNYTVTKVIQLSGSQPVAAAFSASSNNVNTNAQVNFTNASQNANTYSWNFGDGSSASNLISPAHTYTAPGVYTVELTATNTTGCSANSNQTITVSSTATAINVVTENGISMWSNKNNVYVDFSNTGADVNAVIKIYDVLGQELSEDRFTLNGLYQKEIDNVEAAYVIVAVKNNDKITTKKLFINNITK